jgi:hypothetical protein
VELIEDDILTFEDDHLIAKCWLSGSKEYIQGKHHITVMKYHDAVNTLECLVVQ